MLNQFPLWKNLTVAAVMLLGLLFALPNLFGQDPSIAITGIRGTEVGESLRERIEKALGEAGAPVKSSRIQQDQLLLHFAGTQQQSEAQRKLPELLGEDYNHALTLAPDLPGWLIALGGEPMNLGLDLRGGVHVLIDVDMETALSDRIENYAADVRVQLRQAKLRYSRVVIEQGAILASFRDVETREAAYSQLGNEFRDLSLERIEGDEPAVKLFMPPAAEREVRKAALDQNITTIRNRVNALGVAEPLVQQQGDRRIVVELAGVQDPTQVKNILGATATLEYRLVDTEHDVVDAASGKVPPGSKLYKVRRDGSPILLSKKVIVTGNQITDASSGFDQQSGRPAVFVSLDSKGARQMREVTTENVGKPMAVVFKETRTVGRDAEGKPVKRVVEEVISVANILEPFGKRFQTTGLDSPQEAHSLALLLRSGALAAPIDIIEERTIGPSLGQDNIDQGMLSVIVGLAVVMVFMVIYYRVFGMIANLALLVNLVLIVAILSILQATLTMPGIAGIVLTVGMAVDANVLIFERIREELRIGNTPQSAIHSGFERAWGTILDSNVTTLIAAIVLFSLGSGPVRGFAVTLAIGIATSMFTAIQASRALVNLLYGGKRIKKLPI